MKSFVKILGSLALGICLLVVGIKTGGLEQVKFPYLNIFNRSRLTDVQLLEDITHNCHYSIQELNVDVSFADIRIVEKDVKNVNVSASHVYDGFKILENDDQLDIYQPAYWGRDLKEGQSTIVITIPKGFQFNKINFNHHEGETIVNNINTKELNINSRMGTLEIDKIKCDKLYVDTKMTQTHLSELACHKDINANVNMSELKISFQDKIDYNYNVDIFMGKAEIGDKKYSSFHSSNHHNSTEKETHTETHHVENETHTKTQNHVEQETHTKTQNHIEQETHTNKEIHTNKKTHTETESHTKTQTHTEKEKETHTNHHMS